MLKKVIKFSIILVFFGLLPHFRGAFAGFMKFDNTTATVSTGSTFQIAVIVDPGSDSINATDIYVTYDSALLKATAVSAGSLFPTVSNDIATSGRVYIAGMVNDPASSVSTSGTVATITFEGLKDGSATLSFDCNLSKIVKNDINATNVINCSQNGTSSVTVGAGGANPTAAPTTLPESGILDNLVKFAIPGIILLLLGSALRFVL